MDERSKIIEELLLNEDFVRWVSNPTPALDQKWHRWQKGYPDGEAAVAEARRLVDQMKAIGQYDLLPEQEVRQLWQGLQRRHAEAHGTDRAAHKIRWYWMAASISVFLAAGIFLILQFNKPALITYRSAYGKTRHILLPDSSLVLLNANSSITYTKDWLASSERKVTLKGEAFFEVRRTDDHQRFMVETNAVTVVVLGTSFNVFNRRDRTQVVLREGKVTLRNESSAVLQSDITMQPGELVEIEKSNYVQYPVSAEKYTAWTRDEHVFEGTTIAEIAQVLEDIYGLTIKIDDDAIATKKFTGRVTRGDLNSLFGQLEKVFHLSIERKRHLVIIQ